MTEEPESPKQPQQPQQQPQQQPPLPPWLVAPGPQGRAPFTFNLPPVGGGSAPNAIMLQLAMQQQSWQAPYPPPEAAERFEAILPGAFNRIITMVEAGQAANISAMSKALEMAGNDTKRGHYLGFTSNLLAMLGAIGCLFLRSPWVAGVFLSVPALAVGKALVESVQRKVQQPPALPMPPAQPPPSVPTTQS